jgi:hypothetical protein
MIILALDLATTCGWARGEPGSVPVCGAVRFGNADSKADAVFAEALVWFSNFLKAEPRIDMLMLESLLPMEAMKGETSRATRDRLAGLHGVVRAVACARGIGEIAEVSVLSVRHHFCGMRNSSKDDVLEKCRELGWPAQDHNAADAAATWSFACALVKPETALQVSPLFGKRPMRVSA